MAGVPTVMEEIVIAREWWWPEECPKMPQDKLSGLLESSVCPLLGQSYVLRFLFFLLLDHSFAASSSPPFLTPQTSKEAVSIVPVGLQIKGEEYSILLSQ